MLLFKEYLIVQGNVYYPNLKMDRSSMNFGCILSDTISTSCLIISNHGPLPVSYFWSFSRETTLFFDVPEVIANAEECMQVDAFHPFEGTYNIFPLCNKMYKYDSIRI